MDMFILILKGMWILGVSGFFIFWLWNYALWFLSSDRHAQEEWNEVFKRTLKAERERIRKEERERIQKEQS